MAAQYSNRQFFRNTPNPSLSQYFAAINIAIDFDIDVLKDTAVDAWQGVLNNLPDAQKAETEADFQSINAMALGGRGISGLIEEAQYHNDSDFIETLSTIGGFHAKAMWAFLNKPAYWRGAAMFLHADNVSTSYWRKRNDLPKNLPPHVEEEDIKALASAISQFFHQKEGRGKNCVVEPYRRNQKEYFFAYPEDFAQSAIEWVSGSLKSQAHHPAFEIIFVYCEAEGSLDIYAPKNTKVLSDLQRMFAQNILKLATLENGKIDKRVYELAPLLEEGFEFKIEPASGITSVLIISLRLRLNHGKNRLRACLQSSESFKH